MKLALCTDVLGNLSFTDMLDRVKQYGINGVEMTAGGWSPCPHVNTEELLESPEKLAIFRSELEKRGMEIVALNCSGNPLAPGELGKKHSASSYRTVELAAKLGVKKIVMMSGLPGGCPEDRIPNWITSTISWPDYMPGVIDYQWNQVAIPWWQAFARHAEEHGIEKIALEEFPSQLVYNPDTLLRLRNAVGDIIGMNLDPSHLIAMGADPIAAARKLEGAVYHVHGKDARIERGLADVDGLMEYKPVTDTKNRTWNYVAVGCGQDLKWWKEFFSVLRMTGYDGYVSLEMEDLTMSVEAGLRTSIDALNASLSR
ncbi:sugar phosphate isomerase/epimerase family protein [Klebsiella pneumoniae]|uniref:sugar phosphate isomerase/epimerase family protein n=1 Tax=Klebsiella pneumoniae TaxID=573 RepID=UPI00103358E0|nr:sugar phosphate isomerase/epimerase [Klebsiella pneumoniae]HDU3814604.1 sugar phosphate isomerase/epimerase [Klebsiella pneumoniae subsp. pneumoniae]MCI7875476.1 sugar phosphate isomerase/epimerase [Klebsiella pneumoniae]MCI7906360.1 sugar phosphate isomerase/epimerase [Klebsiella pneumoniae]HCB1274632.1 sugar phosphate isomerase/epimerase [Klebsiella pneumoniae]HDU5586705.1 sugar phosphate isomerase/epimerase [Klebsiella pneumoniae subsp. pneumoniae]